MGSSSGAPQASKFPPGGHGHPAITCDRCGDKATRGYEGAGVDGFLNFCDGCYRDFGRWLNNGE